MICPDSGARYGPLCATLAKSTGGRVTAMARQKSDHSTKAALPDPGVDIQLRIEGDPDHRTLQSRVVQSDNRRGALVVWSPAWEGQSMTAAVGTRMAMLWSTGAGEHIMVAGLVAIAEDRIPVWVVRAESPPQMAQRRNYVRVDMLSRITLNVAGADIQATSLDLSEGGMRVSVKPNNRISEGQSVSVTLDMGDKNTMAVRAEVMRTWDRTGPPRIDAGLQFKDLSKQETDAIRERVFVLLRQQRRREGNTEN